MTHRFTHQLEAITTVMGAHPQPPLISGIVAITLIMTTTPVKMGIYQKHNVSGERQGM